MAIFLTVSTGICTDLEGRFETAIRKPAAAGAFYAESPHWLTAGIKALRESAVAPFPGKPVAIISPHAGYIYSGQIAADAFNQAAGHDYDLVVLLGTNHTTAGFNGISIYAGKGYETPLGIAKIDKSVSMALLNADDRFIFLESVHQKEHSIEVQVPFVQLFFPNTPIVSAIVGTDDPGLCIRFGKILADVIKTRNALIVASTDLSHYPEYEDAVAVDRETIAAIVTMDISEMARTFGDPKKGRVKELYTRACGSAPVFAAVAASRAMGAHCARPVSYANSGDASIGDPSKVVGYAAMAFYPGKPCSPATLQTGGNDTANIDLQKDRPIDRAGQVALLAFARKTIDQYLRSKTVPLPRGFDPQLHQRRGAFVTLHSEDRLRGCIGKMTGDRPLCSVVGAMALQAAFNDRRFRPVTPDEFENITIEISVLTPYRTVDGVADIRVDRDGVVLHKGGRSAVFLPQVATEQGWTREQMLERLCMKAGLTQKCWTSGARFETFQAQVFGE